MMLMLARLLNFLNNMVSCISLDALTLNLDYKRNTKDPCPVEACILSTENLLLP